MTWKNIKFSDLKWIWVLAIVDMAITLMIWNINLIYSFDPDLTEMNLISKYLIEANDINAIWWFEFAVIMAVYGIFNLFKYPLSRKLIFIWTLFGQTVAIASNLSLVISWTNPTFGFILIFILCFFGGAFVGSIMKIHLKQELGGVKKWFINLVKYGY